MNNSDGIEKSSWHVSMLDPKSVERNHMAPAAVIMSHC